MPTKTQLLAQIEQLQQENELLRVDPGFGILTRGGLELEYRKLDNPDQYVVFLDLDHIHALNELHKSQEPVDKMVRAAFALRHEDLVISGKWKSGDEIAFIVRADPEGFIHRLLESLKANDLSGTAAAEKIVDGDLKAAVERASQKVYTAKSKNQRGQIVR
jgi:hypothetical protein